MLTAPVLMAMRGIAAGLCVGLGVALTSPPAAAQVSFEGKTLTMIIPYPVGGGTDLAGRLAAEFFAKHLPGAPSIIVRNMPGADGIVGLNYFTQQVKADGLTLAAGAGTNADPLQYRLPQSRFDPTKFVYTGGVGRGGSFLLIKKDAEARLYDRRAEPVTMGSVSGIPRAAMAPTVWGIEFLGWNVRWVLGYPGTTELMLALERGEIDMTATSVTSQIRRVLDTGRIKILSRFEAGASSRPEFGDVPAFTKMIEGKLTQTVTSRAYDYSLATMAADKWFALPPGTPPPVVEAYRQAYARFSQSPEFLERGRRLSDDFVPMTVEEISDLINTIGNTPPEATAFLDSLHRKQGLVVGK
jgi:putative tricarboxylic transport membrane protein